jgi:predicted TIM-barrel fold metal-dependent hydrolase
MKQTVDDFIALGWSDKVLEKVLSGNAKRLLKL